MTKQQVIAEIMYEVRMQGSASFEADNMGYEVYKDSIGRYQITGANGAVGFPNAAECRKGIAKAGNVIIQM